MNQALHNSFILAVVLIASLPKSGIAADGVTRDPDPAAGAFVVEPGLRLELVAEEPVVESPCALAFDERGRLFVAENRGYPTGPAEGESPVGRIALLEDADGDGRYEKRTDFATGLTFPNGLMPWRDGLIVTCSPEVLFLKDTNGDGKADERRVLLTGFGIQGSTQLRASHPTLSMDGWVYITSGLSGGKIASPLAPERVVEVGRTDIRFQPDTGLVEAADGGAQFGLSFDDFGRRFICYNRVHVQQVVLASAWLRRNPHLAFSDTVENCPAEMLPERLKGHGSAAQLFPISHNVTTADSHEGTFTAACGVTIYRGTALPSDYRGGVFSCDPTGNLLHFDRLEPRGATFTARRAHAGREVLASSDDWFRPVFLANAPDGALYICDMHRKTIEHPDYLPAEIRKHTEFESGKKTGRIYRLVGEAADAKQLAVRRAGLQAEPTVDSLCDKLADPDGWWSDTAFRLLLERKDPTAGPPLKQVLQGSPQSTDAKPVVLALRLLDALGLIDDGLIAAALRHPSAAVREHGVQLAFARLGSLSQSTEVLLTLANDPDPRVRFYDAFALGGVAGARAIEPLAEIALQDAADRWTRAAALSSIAGREPEFLEALIAPVKNREPGNPELFYELGRILAAGQPADAWPKLLARISIAWKDAPFEQQIPLLTGIADGLRSQGKHGSTNIFSTVLKESSPANAELAGALNGIVSRAVQTAADSSQSVDHRRWAVALAAFADFPQAGETLLNLIEPHESEVLQTTAIRALVGMHDESIVGSLLARERFSRYAPHLRDGVLSAIASATHQVPGLLAALETGVIDPADLDSTLRRQLTDNRDESIRQRATKLFGAAESGDRNAVYEDYKSVLQLPPAPENGRAVFKRVCTQCHRLDREGVPVGPDLFGIRNQPKEAILLHILIPDREITTGFRAYMVQTKDGRVLTGLISSETPTSIMLRQALGKEESLLRQDIDELMASKTSLMPQGLEKTISRQEFADLLAYLKGEAK